MSAKLNLTPGKYPKENIPKKISMFFWGIKSEHKPNVQCKQHIQPLINPDRSRFVSKGSECGKNFLHASMYMVIYHPVPNLLFMSSPFSNRFPRNGCSFVVTWNEDSTTGRLL
jgi:hypothetical protein